MRLSVGSPGQQGCALTSSSYTAALLARARGVTGVAVWTPVYTFCNTRVRRLSWRVVCDRTLGSGTAEGVLRCYQHPVGSFSNRASVKVTGAFFKTLVYLVFLRPDSRELTDSSGVLLCLVAKP